MKHPSHTPGSRSSSPQDAFKQWLPQPVATSNPWGALASNAAAGAAAGALSLAIVYPFEFATVRLAADLGQGSADRQFGQGKEREYSTQHRPGPQFYLQRLENEFASKGQSCMQVCCRVKLSHASRHVELQLCGSVWQQSLLPTAGLH